MKSMKRYIKWAIVWCLPNCADKIKTEYIIEVPKGVTRSYYLWIATGMRVSYKNQCFVNKLKGTKEYIFKNPAN